MIGDTESAQRSARSELVITRIFDAPVELVWRAWTDPQHFKTWWGPRGYICPFCEMDFRQGGRYLNCMRSPEGKDYWTAGVYKEIIPFKKIVYTDSFADEAGNIVPATHYGMDPNFPLETLVTVTFEEVGAKTKMTLRHAGMPLGETSEQARAGWNESFDKLAESLR